MGPLDRQVVSGVVAYLAGLAAVWVVVSGVVSVEVLEVVLEKVC